MIPFTQIRDVNVVPNAGAVGSGVVITKDGELRALANDDLLNEGEEVIGEGEGLISE
jgi:hypothetical protein